MNYDRTVLWICVVEEEKVSYIRYLSNPEDLYVWNTVTNTVEFTWSVGKPLSSGRKGSMSVPRRVFERACSAWSRGDEDVSIDGFNVKEEHVFVKTGKKVPEGFTQRIFDKAFVKKKRSRRALHAAIRRMSDDTAFLVRVGYKKDFVYLWRVTWEHVVSNAIERQR